VLPPTIDLADLFCELSDGIAAADMHAQAEGWMRDRDVAGLAADVGAAALEGRLDAAAERARVAGAGDDARVRTAFAVLSGIDAAFAHATPLTATRPPPALAEYVMRYAETGRLDSGALPGALLPRFARRGRAGQLPDDLTDAFGSVVRVPAIHWDACEHEVLPAHARLSASERGAALRVGATPLIADPDELSWEVHERRGLRFYRIEPRVNGAMPDRIARIIAAWDDNDVTIGIVPELCLSADLVELWRETLATRPRAGTSRLRLVLAGTGNVDGTSPPSNTALLLDACTGEVLARQSKLHPFNFSRDDLSLWQLEDRLRAPIDEDLARGERVCVIEAGATRLAMLVCEDLARLHRFAAALHAHGVSLILVPVFARPTKDRRWERARAEVYSDAIGATVVVANSLVMATILGTESPAGTALAVTPGEAAVGRTSAPDDVVVFSLSADEPRLVSPSA
jgi:predicted amidohydrolase